MTDSDDKTSMDLILWRHAEAEDGLPDAARKLTRRGQRQAEDMAAWLQGRLPKKLAVVASPATRTQETAAALGLPVITDRRLGVGRRVQRQGARHREQQRGRAADLA